MFISKEELNRRLSNSSPTGPPNTTTPRAPHNSTTSNPKTTTTNTPQQNTTTSNPNSKSAPQRHSTTNIPNNTPQPPQPPQHSSSITSCISSLLDKNSPDHSKSKVGPDRRRNLNSLTDEALEKTLQALGMITPDKLIGLSAEKLSRIACNTSKIIDNCREDKDITTGINITIYSPEQKSESSYKVIDVAR